MGLMLATCGADIVELAALRDGRDAVRAAALARGVELPPFGRVSAGAGGLALSVRPGRWLVLSPPAAAGETALHWQSAIGVAGAAIDQSSGLDVLHLAGAAVCEVLARGCRLDLDPRAHEAAATVLAQVPAIVVSLGSGLLLLTPSSTARHVREWLAMTAHNDGFERQPDLTLNHLLSKEIQ